MVLQREPHLISGRWKKTAVMGKLKDQGLASYLLDNICPVFLTTTW